MIAPPEGKKIPLETLSFVLMHFVLSAAFYWFLPPFVLGDQSSLGCGGGNAKYPSPSIPILF